MKSIILISVISALALSTATLSAQPDKDSQKNTLQSNYPTPEKIVEKRVDRLSEVLGLDEKQRQQIYDLQIEILNRPKQIKDCRDGECKTAPSASERQVMEEQRKAEREDNYARMKSILTTEQYEKWTQIRIAGPDGHKAREESDHHNDLSASIAKTPDQHSTHPTPKVPAERSATGKKHKHPAPVTAHGSTSHRPEHPRSASHPRGAGHGKPRHDGASVAKPAGHAAAHLNGPEYHIPQHIEKQLSPRERRKIQRIFKKIERKKSALVKAKARGNASAVHKKSMRAAKSLGRQVNSVTWEKPVHAIPTPVRSHDSTPHKPEHIAGSASHLPDGTPAIVHGGPASEVGQTAYMAIPKKVRRDIKKAQRRSSSIAKKAERKGTTLAEKSIQRAEVVKRRLEARTESVVRRNERVAAASFKRADRYKKSAARRAERSLSKADRIDRP